MVATVRCEEIASHIKFSFALNQDWVELSEAIKSHHVPDFGKKFRSLLHNCLSKYDEDAMYYDKNVGSAKRNQLEEKVMNLAQPTIKLMLKHIRSMTLDNFKSSLNNALKERQGFVVAALNCAIKSMRLFEKQCEEVTSYQAILDSTKIRDKFSKDLYSHATKVRATKLYELTKEHELKFEKALCSKVEIYLKEASDNTWPAIKTHLRRETRTAVSNFSSALTGFEMDAQENGGIISKLKDYGRRVVEGKAREVAGKVKYLMKERFELVFWHGNDSKPRDWCKKDDIGKIANAARSTSLKLLSVLAAIRLDGESDRIWDTLTNGTKMSPHLLVSTTWEEVSATNTLITPIQCKSLWDPFKRETERDITQAIAIQKSKKSKRKRVAKSLKRLLRVAKAVTTTQGVATTVCTIGIVAAVTVATLANAGILVVPAAGVGLVLGAAFSVKKPIRIAGRRAGGRVHAYEGEACYVSDKLKANSNPMQTNK